MMRSRATSPSGATSTAWPSSSRPCRMKLATFRSSSATRMRIPSRSVWHTRMPRARDDGQGPTQATPGHSLAYWPRMGRYVVREDVAVADCALEIEGRDLDDLFETAARAVAELMVDPATVPTAVRREIALSSPA